MSQGSRAESQGQLRGVGSLEHLFETGEGVGEGRTMLLLMLVLVLVLVLMPVLKHEHTLAMGVPR